MPVLKKLKKKFFPTVRKVKKASKPTVKAKPSLKKVIVKKSSSTPLAGRKTASAPVKVKGPKHRLVLAPRAAPPAQEVI
jgi:hypothetical protein